MSKNQGSWHFLWNATILFYLLHNNRGQHYNSDLGVPFQKNISGISRWLSVKKRDFLTFFWKNYYIFFDFLYDYRGQPLATSDLGVWFQKNNHGISRWLSVKNQFLWHFLGNANTNYFDFCMIIETNTEQHLA